jgi:cyclic pyranopterin phosphate synthase
MNTLTDPYDRRLNYLRLSLTDRCNLRCLYCMPPEGAVKLRHQDILTYEEILRLAAIAVSLGVTKIRLTGGEPLVRKGIHEFLPHLTALVGLKEVSFTTNGILLKERLNDLKAWGIKRLNISLDTLNREKYRKITGYDGLEQTLESIEAARRAGFQPVKINVVVLEGINDDELLDFAKLSLNTPYHIRFIEYMPVGVTRTNPTLRHVPNARIKDKLSQIGRLVEVPRRPQDGPAERFKFENAPGEIGFISPLSHAFCHLCNRLRLTANGHLKPCLLSPEEEDLMGPMRQGASDEDLAQIFLKAAFNKPRSHQRVVRNSIPGTGQMCSIGG